MNPLLGASETDTDSTPLHRHYRDATETSTGRIDELENEFEEAQEKITDLEDELSRAETSAEEAKFRVEELEEKLITADE